jgi:hypothetical protein
MTLQQEPFLSLLNNHLRLINVTDNTAGKVNNWSGVITGLRFRQQRLNDI